MNVKIVNLCKNPYHLDAEKIVRHILERVPEKFLVGLKEVHITESKKNELPDIKYIPQSSRSPHPVIEIDMNHITLSGRVPFFPTLTLNGMFIFAIHEHIKRYLKRHSNDEEILSYRPGRIDYDWMYLGIWNPLLTLFKIMNYSIYRFQTFHKTIFYMFNRIFKFKRRDK